MFINTAVVQNMQSNAGTLELRFSRSGTKVPKYAAKSTRPLSVVYGFTVPAYGIVYFVQLHFGNKKTLQYKPRRAVASVFHNLTGIFRKSIFRSQARVDILRNLPSQLIKSPFNTQNLPLKYTIRRSNENRQTFIRGGIL